VARPPNGNNRDEPITMLSRIAPYLLLALLGLVFFARLVLHPTQLLYSDHSDLLAEHVPAKRFLVSAWQETGELPFWCPYNFSGMPFIHDPQLGAFYPLHLPLYFLPEQAVGPALGWLTVFHVILAGWCMFAYATHRGFGKAGALIAAVGYMFAGKWMLHVLAGGHYIVLGLAWLPLLVLLLEVAMRRGSMLRATWAGAVLALMILSMHPQITFYAGLFVALWTLGPALEQARVSADGVPRPRRRTVFALGRWLGCGGWAVLVAVGLSAVQLLPSYEAAALSSRAAGIAPQQEPPALLNLAALFGPYLYSMSWEYQAGLGVVWLATASLSLWLCPLRARWPAIVCLVLFAFALGGRVVLDRVPGFTLFRTPGRMLLLAGFPLAYLSGLATDALVSAPALTARLRGRCILFVLCLAVGAGLLCAWAVTKWGQPFHFFPYWASLFITIPAMVALLLLNARLGPSLRAFAWGTLILIDLWALSWPLVETRPEEAIFVTSRSVRILADNIEGHPRVLDRGWKGQQSASPLGSGAPLAMLHRIEPMRGYNPLDVLRYKEYLQFMGDRDRPLRALDGPLTFPVMDNFDVTNQSLLNLLGVRYILQPSDEPPASKNWQVMDRDDAPETYDFVAGGQLSMPAYTLYRNPDALPRAFIVPEAAPLPDRDGVLAALRGTDFRRRVLLDGIPSAEGSSQSSGAFRPASITSYQPNQVVVDVTDTGPGWLVLTDVWYPGWRCTVDGQEAQLYRANYLFRAVRVPADAREVVFSFAPDSFRRGKLMSFAACAGLLLSLLVGTWSRITGHGAHR
jgi:hypothetical protein